MPDEPVVDPQNDTEEQKTFDAAYVRKLRDEAAAHRLAKVEAEKRLAAIDAERQAKLKEQSDYKTLLEQREAELQKLRDEVKAQTISATRAKIGAEFGLPSALLARLQGESEDDMRKDAEILKGLIPAEAPTPKTNATTPLPTGSTVVESNEQRLRRLQGRSGSSPLFKRPT